MFKNLISPIQAWLLSQGRCVGCGESLNTGKETIIKQKNIVTCRCGRMFVHDTKKKTFRRALFDEIE